MTAVALITFVRSAQEFIYAATFLTRTGVKTSPVGLYMFFTELGVEWGQLTAAPCWWSCRSCWCSWCCRSGSSPA